MKLKEETHSKEGKWRDFLTRAEAENFDLKFIVEQNKENYKKLEHRNGLLSAKLEELLSKTYIPGGQKGLNDPNLSLNEMNPTGKFQEFYVSRTLVPPREQFVRSPQLDVIDRLKVTDEMIIKFQKELTNAAEETNLLKDQIQEQTVKLAHRDQEIERLSGLMAQGAHVQALPTRAHYENSKETISGLNDKIDFLNRENVRLAEDSRVIQLKLTNVARLDNERDSLHMTISKLNTDREALTEQLENQRIVLTQPIEQLTTELRSKETAVENYKNQILTLGRQLQSLQCEAAKANSLHVAYSSDKRIYNEVVEKLKTEKSMALEDYREAQTKYESLYSEFYRLQESLRMREVELNNIKHEVSLKSQQFSRVGQEHCLTTEDLYSAKHQLSSEQSRSSLLQNELSNLKFELQKSLKQREYFDSQVTALLTENSRLKEDLEASLSTKAKLQAQMDSGHRQLLTLSVENENLNKLQTHEKSSNSLLEGKNSDLLTRINCLSEQLRSHQNSNTLLTDELTAKHEETRKLEYAKMALERELAELRPVKKRWEDAVSELSQLKEARTLIDFDLIHSRKETDELKDSLNHKQQEIQQLKQYLDELKQERDASYKETEQYTNSAQSLGIAERKIGYLEEELSLVKKQSENSRNKERGLYKEIEELKTGLSRAEDARFSAEKQTERSTQHKNDLDSQVLSLQKTLSEANDRENALKSQRVQLEEQNRQLTLALSEHRSELSHSNTERSRFEEDSKFNYNSLLSEQSNSSRLSVQIAQLKALNASIESTRTSLEKTIEALKLELLEKGDSIESLKDESTLLKRKQLANDSEKSKASSQREELLAQVDGLTMETSRLQEESKQLKSTLRSQQTDSAELRTKLKLLNDSGEQSNKTIEKTHSELQELHSQLARRQKEQNLQLEQSAELQELVQHTATHNKELQSQVERLESQLQSAVSATVAGHKELEGALHVEKSLNNSLSSLQTGLCDSQSQVKSLQEQLSTLSKDHNSLRVDNQSLLLKVSALESQVSSAHSAQDESVEKLSQEVKSLEQSLKVLRLELVESEESKRHLERVNTELSTQLSCAQYASQRHEGAQEELQSQLLTLESERATADSLANSLSADLKNARIQLDYERKKQVDSELVLVKERERVRGLQEEIRELERKEHIPPQRNEDLYRQIKDYRSENLSLEMEQARLKEELSKTKHLLYKAESQSARLSKDCSP